MRKRLVVGALLVAALALAAAVGLSTRAAAAPKLTNVTLQLKWVPQAQFAGYYAASLKGFYKAAGLNVTLKNGGPDIIPEQVVAPARRSSASTGCRACSRATRAPTSSTSRRSSPASG
jgi:ABC-type nitrate/sulfonate/bicarbonate transport systems, periplasmic components